MTSPAERWFAPLVLVAALSGIMLVSCRGRAAGGAHPVEADVQADADLHAVPADATEADAVTVPAEPDAAAASEAVAEAVADDSEEAAPDVAARADAAPAAEARGEDVGALDLDESDPCDPELPAEVVAMRNEEDTRLRRAHAAYAPYAAEDDECTPGADCPEPLPDLNGDGRPEYLIEINYCDSSSWDLVASAPEGYERVLSDQFGRTEVLTPKLADGTRVLVTVHDCCCMSYVKVLRIEPDGDVQRLYGYESDCGACATWVEEQIEAGATGAGQGAYEARPEIEDDVLRGVREPEDCSGTRYRLIEIGSSPAESGASM